MKYSELKRLLSSYTGEQANGHPLWFSPISRRLFKMSNHGAQEVPKGTLHQILKEAGIR